MMPAPGFADKIDEIIGVELSPLGFERTRPRRWVEGGRPPIRRIFEFQALRGISYSARWGLSLDFVPLWRAGRLRWKRTAKTAEFDLCVDPIDQHGVRPDWCSFPCPIWPREAGDFTRMILVARESLRAAKLDFGRANSISDVAAMFQERAAMQFRRFSLENYTQTHLAWGLSLIAVGDQAEGERHLELFCGRSSVDRSDRIIRQAVLSASAAT